MQNLPLIIQEVVKLSSFEIPPTSFKFGVTNFESDQYISIADPKAADKQFTVIELQNNMKCTKKPLKAEAVIMHPKDNIISLKAKKPDNNGFIIQIFNLDTKAKLKSLDFSEPIVFWTWVSLNKLALVTQTSVYHTDITNSDPGQYVKVLDRKGNLEQASTQIIGYKLEQQEKWCALFGISTPDAGKTILGHIQLFLIEGGKQQLIDGHCCTFGEAFIHSDTHKSSLFCFVEKKQNETISKVHVTEISAPPAGFTKHKRTCEISYSPEFANDFPVVMNIEDRLGLLFIVTKFGFLFVYELTTGSMLLRTRVSNDAVFIGSSCSKSNGLYTINKAGSVTLIKIDETKLAQFIIGCTHIPNSSDLSFLIASRYKLQGLDHMFIEQFNKYIVNGQYQEAANIAASAPGTLLRNADTIQKFKGLQSFDGKQPLLVYFQILLAKGRLNDVESLELVEPAISSGKYNFVENWIKEDKLTYTEQLGDLVRKYNKELSITIYERAQCYQKLSQVYLELGRVQDAQRISAKVGIQMDHMAMLQSLIPLDPQGAFNAAKNVCAVNPNVNTHQIAELFLKYNRIQELSAFCVECMQTNKPEDAFWQTKVLESNLISGYTHIAEAIFNMEKWSQFNKQHIAGLCEQQGLLQRALEFYQDLKDIRRVILNTHIINHDWLVTYLEKQDSDTIITCLGDLMKHNRQNLKLVINICNKTFQKLNIADIIEIFQSVGAFDGIYFFLGSIINNTTDKDIHFKFIESATKCNQIQEVSRIIREKKDCYDPIKVKEFLKTIKLSDPKPLIALCDVHGYIEELTQYLYKNNLNKYIEVYIFKINQASTPIVLSTLVDLECEESYIKQLLYTIRGQCPIEEIIAEFEKRNKLRVLENWLDSRVAEGNQLQSVHNALAKIKVDTNQDPQSFLTNNQFYDAQKIGKYCEERDPHLAVLAYKRAWGQCDQELIEITNKNSLYRIQARYLVERQCKELWAEVLSTDNPHRKMVIDNVIQQALPDSKDVDEVQTTVQSFMAAGLTIELLSLLEKIVLHNSEFGQYKKLQNLLIITAIKSDKNRVMDYIKKLDNYDGPQIAKIALGEDYKLFEEAFIIYQKQNFNVEAIEVLLNNIESFERALEFAEKCKQPDVFSKLASAYLDKFQIIEAIDCYLKANNAQNFLSVIQAAEGNQNFELLIKFLLMAREQIKDANIDNSLAYCYAKLNLLSNLEEFVNNPNSIDVDKIGQRCYDEKMYEAACMLFQQINNNSKIAGCYVRLGQFTKAIDAAKKANTPKTWKQVCIACVEQGEYRLASIAGMEIIIHPDHLDELIQIYEQQGAHEEIISLLHRGMTQERAHVGIFTELGILYAKYQPEKLMEHCKSQFQKLNISKILRTCEKYFLWEEAFYLYENYGEADNAINIMIEHFPSAFNHEKFVSCLQKVSNHELYYKAMYFYFDNYPDKLNDLLKQLTNFLDLTKTVNVMKKIGNLPLILPFLKSVQSFNNQAINEALNSIYLEQWDFTELFNSIKTYENFEPVSLSKLTENHELMEFRRIAAYLYRKIQKFELSIEISKKDQMYRDCIETAAESKQPKFVEELMKFFVANGEKEMFTALLYSCYDYVKPDIAMELAWRFGLMDYAMPYFIQIMKELTSNVETVQKKHDDREKKEKEKLKQQQNQPLEGAHDILNPLHNNMLLPPMPGLGGSMNLNTMGIDPMMGMGGIGTLGSMGTMGTMGIGGQQLGMQDMFNSQQPIGSFGMQTGSTQFSTFK